MPPYPAGTACAFQTPPSSSRLPNAPNGVSALAANAAAPAGSACTGLTREGITQGRLATATTASVITSRRIRSPPDHLPRDRPPQRATGTAASAVMDIAAKPP